VTSAVSVLVVDDEEPILFALGRYFQARGRHVETAAALNEALQLVRTRKFDVVIADLRLSVATRDEGLDLLAEVRTLQPDAITILLTAYRSPGVTERAMSLGVSSCLDKPQPLADLDRLAEKLLEERAERA
jgi:DNA-binding NtrC family response regulator